MSDYIDILRKIIGGRLTSVQFVMNYLILGFDERGALTTLVWPEILISESVVKYGMKGYRDSLCDLINQVIRDVEIQSNESIDIIFDNKTLLHIPYASYTGSGERAIFTNPKNELFVL